MIFKQGNTYSFSTLAPAVLGERYENVKVIAVGSYEFASAITNVDVLHNNVLAMLPAGTEKDPQKLDYVVVLVGGDNNTNSRKVFATVWISEASVEEYQNLIATFTVQIATPADTQRIRNLLSAAGYNKVASTTGNTG